MPRKILVAFKSFPRGAGGGGQLHGHSASLNALASHRLKFRGVEGLPLLYYALIYLPTLPTCYIGAFRLRFASKKCEGFAPVSGMLEEPGFLKALRIEGYKESFAYS